MNFLVSESWQHFLQSCPRFAKMAQMAEMAIQSNCERAVSNYFIYLNRENYGIKHISIKHGCFDFGHLGHFGEPEVMLKEVL